ncbi:hypothetical protein EDD68_1101 [Melghiribacillus thermohalophilus]|uniref:Lactococcin 972 family bacteriocin n=1 Tax=Melghiribacillus thermohalophilus TaxID=1324956 RepID=A0A4R3N0L1_9BACI|nr:hypothetical protein [Melghiribacillus thermohalophilus]TCT21697.1 hypothetical protein EDD68_1101 [Melghiribacillus thermohalophilus]
MKKLAITGLLLLVFAFVGATSSFATTHTYSSAGEGFDKAWENYAGTDEWFMEYGYNTAWINEDYTTTFHESRHHTATVSNANGSFTDEDDAGAKANISVRHSGSTVYYSISY